VDISSASIAVFYVSRPRYAEPSLQPRAWGGNIHLVRVWMSLEKKNHVAAFIKRARDLITSILGFHTGPEVVILVKKT
jgi:hypothetical protein